MEHMERYRRNGHLVFFVASEVKGLESFALMQKDGVERDRRGGGTIVMIQSITVRATPSLVVSPGEVS